MGCHFWRGRPFYGRAFPDFGDVGRERVGCGVGGHWSVPIFNSLRFGFLTQYSSCISLISNDKVVA